MSKQVEIKKSSWIEKVLAKLNLSEKSKVGLMQERLIKYYKEEKRKIEANIETITRNYTRDMETAEEELLEIKEAEDAAFIDLDLDKVNTVESRKAYIAVLDRQFNEAIKARKEKEEEIERKTKDFDASIKSCEKALEIVELKMSKLQ